MSQNTARFTLEELIVKKLWVEGKRIQTLDLGALVVSDPNYNVGIGTDTPTVRLDISGTSGLRLPVGTTSERPNPSNLSGIIRYNSSTNSYEGYNMGGWTSLGGTTSIDQQTKIEADNNDGLKFITDNVERMRIKENGVIDISTNVDVSGTIAVENLDVSNNVQIYGYTNLKGGHLVIDDQYSSISDAMSKLEFKIRNNFNTPSLVGQILAFNDGTSAGNGKLKFQVAHGGNYQDALIIDKDKNVTFTGSQLDISGGDILAQRITTTGPQLDISSGNILAQNLRVEKIGIGVPTNETYELDISGEVRIENHSNISSVLTLGKIYRDGTTIDGRMDFGKNGIRMWYDNYVFSGPSNSYAFINIEGGQTSTTKLNMGKGVESTFTNILTLDLANERVGIGTDNPILDLDVNGTRMGRCIPTAQSARHDADKRNSFYIGRWDSTSDNDFIGLELKVDTETNMGFGSAPNQSAIIFKNWGNGFHVSEEVMRINSNGYVGIGTDSPGGKLHVQGGHLYLYGNTISGTNEEMVESAQNAQIYLDCNNESNTDPNGIIWKTRYGSYTKKSAQIMFQPEGNYFRGGLGFYTGNAADQTTDADERMRIDMNGNVGIGTPNPDSKLHILSTQPSNGDPGFISRIQETNNTYFSEFKQRAMFASGPLFHFKLNEYNENQSTTNPGFLVEGRGGSDFFCIKQNGSVGIGTDSPGTKLEVVQDTAASSLTSLKTSAMFLTKGQDNNLKYINIGTYYNLSTIYGGGSGTSYNLVLNPPGAAGRVGIGIVPTEHLHICAPNGSSTNILLENNDISLTENQIISKIAFKQNDNTTNGIGNVCEIKCVSVNTGYYGDYYGNSADLVFSTGTYANSNSDNDVLTISHQNRVGVGTTSPNYPLEIAAYKSVSQDIFATAANNATGFNPTPNTIGYYLSYDKVHLTFASGNSGGTAYTVKWIRNDTTEYNDEVPANINISVRSHGAVWAQEYFASSDKRIKTNIEIPNRELVLQTLQDISCVIYEYKDKIKHSQYNTLGFIAQQVKEHFPIAVTIQTQIIPNEMRNIENPQWTTLTDSSGNNTFKLTINDLSDNSGNILYRFYVSNDPSGNDECKKEIQSSISEPNSFIFKEKWNNVFVYGKQVNDFHTLDKQKLFTLNFSATQEIDRIQQEEKTKLEEANQKILELEVKNQQLETTLQQVLQRLDALENN